ncbi:hypothetical protein TRIUR3_22597 [Triticum urartu]|uniref:Uncharacterized protein n=1 Tax=Triticum urartu TaxID=4572 RepID=M7Z052_TRIUA|nr:hypothetical protein TRIUR3_22597 [Triticum urartu]
MVQVRALVHVRGADPPWVQVRALVHVRGADPPWVQGNGNATEKKKRAWSGYLEAE